MSRAGVEQRGERGEIAGARVQTQKVESDSSSAATLSARCAFAVSRAQPGLGSARSGRASAATTSISRRLGCAGLE